MLSSRVLIDLRNYSGPGLWPLTHNTTAIFRITKSHLFVNL